MPFPTPGDLPNPRVEPASLVSPALVRGFFTTSTTWEAQVKPYSDLTMGCLQRSHLEALKSTLSSAAS